MQLYTCTQCDPAYQGICAWVQTVCVQLTVMGDNRTILMIIMCCSIFTIIFIIATSKHFKCGYEPEILFVIIYFQLVKYMIFSSCSLLVLHAHCSCIYLLCRVFAISLLMLIYVCSKIIKFLNSPMQSVPFISGSNPSVQVIFCVQLYFQ